MASIKIKQKGHYENTKRFLKRALGKEYLNILDNFGQRGVALLQNATPKDSGVTAASWNYVISRDEKMTTISWTNNHEVSNSRGYSFNVVILLVYGHATRNGGWVEGYNFINDSMKPLFDEMASKMWLELTQK